MFLSVILALVVTIPQLGLPRSRPLIRQFAKLTGYPNGRPGYVVDHQIPLCAGGPDALENLQWQEVRASYIKDVYERALCKDMARLGLTMVKKDAQHP